MFGFSYGQIFLVIGATAALIGTKDLPMIARTAGRLAGRSIGYVQMARGQFENVMQQSQAKQVHKELQETMQQLEAIRHEIRSISFVNPGPMARSLMDKKIEPIPDSTESSVIPNVDEDQKLPEPILKENVSTISSATNLESQAIAYARLAEAQSKNEALTSGEGTDILNVLPVSAESAGLLPNRKGLGISSLQFNSFQEEKSSVSMEVGMSVGLAVKGPIAGDGSHLCSC